LKVTNIVLVAVCAPATALIVTVLQRGISMEGFNSSILIRAATHADSAAIAAMYAPHALRGTASFETGAPDAGEIARRMSSTHELGLPYFVAEIAGEVAGYAYAGHFRPRAAYRFTVENSVYVAERFQRRGVARALMLRLIAECAPAGLREMVAVIGDPLSNTASVSLHRSLGFTEVGILRGVGEKFGVALDVLLLQRSLTS
jgi:L-amino acid N-acyltransferase YncA